MSILPRPPAAAVVPPYPHIHYVMSEPDAQACPAAPSPSRSAFDRLLTGHQLRAAFGPLRADWQACVELLAHVDPADAERTLVTRLTSYLDALADVLAEATVGGEVGAA